MCDSQDKGASLSLRWTWGVGGAETRSVPWRPIGAGVCLAAGGQDEAGAEGFGPGLPPSPQRQLQGLILAQRAPPLMACAPLSPYHS